MCQCLEEKIMYWHMQISEACVSRAMRIFLDIYFLSNFPVPMKGGDPRANSFWHSGLSTRCVVHNCEHGMADLGS